MATLVARRCAASCLQSRPLDVLAGRIEVTCCPSSPRPRQRGEPVRLAGLRSLGARAGWTIFDQAVSSAATALLSIVVARSVSSAAYGEFALAFSLFGLCTAISQAVNGQVLAIRFPGAGGRRNTETVGAAGGALLTGVCLGLVVLLTASLVAASVRCVLIPLGLFLPALLLQDLWRAAFVSGGRPARAFLNDVTWILLQIGFVGVLLARKEDSAAVFLAAWALGGLLAALLGIYQSGARPSPGLGYRWLLGHVSASRPLLGTALATAGAGQLGLVLVGVFGTVEDIGGIRGAQTLLGPLNIIGFGLAAFAVPEIGRRATTSARTLYVAAGAVSAAFLAVTVVWGGVLLLLSDSWGTALLGETWAQADKALPGMVASMCFLALTVGPSVVIRALDRSTFVFVSAVIWGVLLLILPSIGVRLYGIEGAALGNALASGLAVGPYWLFLRMAVKRGRRLSDARTATVE